LNSDWRTIVGHSDKRLQEVSGFNLTLTISLSIFVLCIQSDQQETKSEQALQIIGHVVAKSYARKRSKHGRRQFMVSNAT
jgi:methyl coenzyme M reductase subunit D